MGAIRLWFCINLIQKVAFIYLEDKHNIKEGDSDGAKRFLIDMVVLFVKDRNNDLLNAVGELKTTKFSAFQKHDLSYFHACKGYVFMPPVEAFIRLLISLQPDSVRALKVAYQFAVEEIRSKIKVIPAQMQAVDMFFGLVAKLVQLADLAPLTFCEGLAAYADNIGRWSLVYQDHLAACSATRASQDATMLRTILCDNIGRETIPSRLDSYMHSIREAGTALYTHLTTPLELPAPEPAYPPTREEADSIRRCEAVEAELQRQIELNALARAQLKDAKDQLKAALANTSDSTEPKESHKKISRHNNPKAQGQEGFKFRVHENVYDFDGDKMRLTGYRQVEYMDDLLDHFLMSPTKPFKPRFSNPKSIFKGDKGKWFSRHVRPYRNKNNKCDGRVILSLPKLPPVPK